MANFDFDPANSSSSWKPKELSSLSDEIVFNSDGWGPVNGAPLTPFSDVPYAHFDKKERVNRAADLGGGQNARANKFKRGGDSEANAEFSYKHDNVEDSSFQLVDTAKLPQSGRGAGRGGGRGGRGGRTNFQQQAGQGRGMGRGGMAGGRGDQGGRGGAFGQQGQFGRGGAGRGGRGGRGNMRRQDRKDRVASLTVQVDWELTDELDLIQLLKLQANPPKAEDLEWCGHLDHYDEAYDKTTSRTAVPLKRVDNKIFYSVTTAEDPVLEKFAVEGIGDIFATDTILAQIMAAPRSIYSWDLVIQKTEGVIYIDKRDNSVFDYLTVSETAHDPPQAGDNTEEINTPEKLSVEASMINQNFSQQVLQPPLPGGDSRKKYEPNPFYDEEEPGFEPASVAYRYRKFPLGKVNLVARTELHGWVNKRGVEQMLNVYALNEWDSRFSGGINWRMKIDQQRGAVLATELKNNSCKVAKWTAQSILSGADQMKVGYVSRKRQGEVYEHEVLATQFFKPKELAVQTNLSVTNMWGVVKMLCELLMTKEDGKFVLLKDPNKATLRLYRVPLNTFEEVEEEEGETMLEDDDEN